MKEEIYNRKSKTFFAEELETITLIHFDAKYYFRDIQYILKPDTTEEIVASENEFIQRLLRSFWRLGIIEISKLFLESTNQHYNLISYLKELIQNYNEYEWINGLQKTKLEEFLNLITSKEVSTTIEKIKIQRDKYFAHLDRNPKFKLKEKQILFEEIFKLLNITEEIISELSNKCLDAHWDFEVSGAEKAGRILEAYSALNEKIETELNAKRDKYIELRRKEK